MIKVVEEIYCQIVLSMSPSCVVYTDEDFAKIISKRLDGKIKRVGFKMNFTSNEK